ncbi:unnamed protein product [Oppiella nova]|uniref:Peptidase C14A caspase catalytic domain-containing protein n=1 Tax=Oppiella nova TaxID=334625 RepID=A0A7R9MHZ5_9ACAR|nr:unnamed protein product [Oppiella nova]CAG2176556.1 unnamed protein product [Oppiella nova]
MLIFTEYTKDSDSCEHLAQILHESGQHEPAQNLRQFNKPIEPIDCRLNVSVTVEKATRMRSGGELWYKMDAKPRGKAFIFVTTDLYFDVEIVVMDSCQEMITTLKAFAVKEFTGDAVIVMYIGHGKEEHICINHVEEDLKKEVIIARTKRTDKVMLLSMAPVDDEYYNQNIGAAYIISTSSEGYMASYVKKNGIYTTIFGRFFMQRLAQDACTLNLKQLFNKTCADITTKSDIEQRPVMREFMVTKDLYFNPGLPKNVDN